MKDAGRQKANKDAKVKFALHSICESFPMQITCPFCAYEVELWTDEDETKCCICGFKLFSKENIIH
ncbi:MAG: hypothetical protein HQL10_01640 [Nitrospirae bacterium]|nr:hypothetical protein [Nitrospirota bacterium]